MAQVELANAQRQRLIGLIASRSGARTATERQNLLNAADLSQFAGRVNLNAETDSFSQQLVRVLDDAGTLEAKGQPALVSLLRWLREKVRGHEDDRAMQVEDVGELFEIIAGHSRVRGVVLNACWSEVQRSLVGYTCLHGRSGNDCSACEGELEESMHSAQDLGLPPTHQHRALFDEVTARVLSVCRPVRIVVFGSYARGTEGPNSDVDVLVVDEAPDSRRARSVQIRRALQGMGRPFDVIVATPEDLERYGDAIGLIYGPAMREGLVIYEQLAA